MPEWIKQHTILVVVITIVGFLLWRLPEWLGQVWPLFTNKTVPDWLAEHRWPGMSTMLYRWFNIGMTIGVFILLGAILYQQQGEDSKREPTMASAPIPQPAHQISPSKPDPMRFVAGWREKVKLSVLKIPRPCVIRVAAAPESVINIQSDLSSVIRESEALEGISGRVLIPACSVPVDLRDSSPDSYVDRPDDAPSGTIVVNAADRKIAELLVNEWGDLGPKVKVGKTLPSEGPADLIYIQVGPREPLGK